MSSPLLVAKNVQKIFPGGLGIYDHSINLNPGSVVSLVGPNGCGKSTLLRILSGLQLPDSGTVQVMTNKGELPPDRCWGWFLGVVSQHTQPWPHLSVLDNLVFPLQKVRGFGLEAARERALEALSQFSLEDRLGTSPQDLSGGLKQRLVLARAFALDPEVLLLDEVTSALDPEWTHRVGEEIKKFAAAGGAVVQVSHRMGQVRELSDLVVFLEGGRVLSEGAPEMVFSEGADPLIRLFLKTS